MCAFLNKVFSFLFNFGDIATVYKDHIVIDDGSRYSSIDNQIMQNLIPPSIFLL